MKALSMKKDLEKWIKILSEQSIISVDTETSSLNPIELI